MANVNNNRLSVTFDAATRTLVIQKIISIDTDMPFLIGLTPEEIKALPTVDATNAAFIRQVLIEIENFEHILPDYFNLAEVRKDYQTYEDMTVVDSHVSKLAARTRDTRMLAGSEAYTGCLLIYRMFKVAVENGVPGAKASYERLKMRFQAQGNSGPRPIPTDEPPVE